MEKALHLLNVATIRAGSIEDQDRRASLRPCMRAHITGVAVIDPGGVLDGAGRVAVSIVITSPVTGQSFEVVASGDFMQAVAGIAAAARTPDQAATHQARYKKLIDETAADLSDTFSDLMDDLRPNPKVSAPIGGRVRRVRELIAEFRKLALTRKPLLNEPPHNGNNNDQP